MKFRVQFDGAFESESEARKVFDKIKEAKTSKTLIDTSDKETYSANIHKCYHDETPTKPCEIIEKVESETIIKE